ncbi:MAG: SRPBCC domain-containing protein, partial [Acidobacteriota bacterium]
MHRIGRGYRAGGTIICSVFDIHVIDDPAAATVALKPMRSRLFSEWGSQGAMMSVKKEASGRRSVQVEVELPGTPEEVWQAIATGAGVSSWFVPTEFHESDGKPVAVTSNFGPGMEVRAAVTAWDPPRTFAAQGEGWGGSPPIATEWIVEARAGGVCLVRVVHSLFASTDEWDNQLESTESGWPGFFRTLRIYLTHFRGQR